MYLERENEKREKLLNNNLISTIFIVSFPLALFNAIDYAYGFLDSVMVSHLGSMEISSVVYLNQVKQIFSGLGIALAAAGGILIARKYGEGLFDEAKKYAHSVFSWVLVICIFLIIIVLPFTRQIMVLVKTPDVLIKTGFWYFFIQIVSIIPLSITAVYLAIERAKGDTKRVLRLNVVNIILKLSLTALVVYVLEMGLFMVAVATLVAHTFTMSIGLFKLTRKSHIFKVDRKSISFNTKYFYPILVIGIPIFFQKMSFGVGKTVFNSWCVIYGPIVLGALGISTMLSGMVTRVTNGFGDGLATIVAQNFVLNKKRAFRAFWITLLINMIFATIVFASLSIFMDQVLNMFANGNIEFKNAIYKIFQFERFTAFPLALVSTIMGLLYGLGYTKMAFWISFIRLFVLRLPVLFVLQRTTNLGSEVIGISMLISNSAVIIFGISILIYVLNKNGIFLKKGESYGV